MTFREIDEALLQLVDPETGEIMDVNAFEELAMERDAKAENMALWVLELESEAESLDREIKRLTGRKKAAEEKAKRLKQYMPVITQGKKFKTDLVSVSYRNTSRTEIVDEKAVVDWALANGNESGVLNYPAPEVSKTAVKKLITSGTKIPGALVIDSLSTIIK